MLETLRNYEVTSTFFCIGDNIRNNVNVFKRIVEDGHSVGNHTFNHLKGWKTDNETYLSNIVLCDQIMNQCCVNSDETNRYIRNGKILFRPPYGRIKRSQIRLLPTHSITMWDVLTYDYDKTLSKHVCLKNSIRATRPGSIIVFHDSFKAEKNMTYALPRFIDHFLNEGYSFSSLHA